jgi:hypothetical protein
LAGALVTVRFTGSSIAGLTFVAATCTPSVLRDSVAWACATVKRRLSVDGVCYLLGYLPPSVMRPPFTIVTTEWGTAATSGEMAVRRAVAAWRAGRRRSDVSGGWPPRTHDCQDLPRGPAFAQMNGVLTAVTTESSSS